MEFTRYALYFAPPTEAPWTVLAKAWLGWDMETGKALEHPVAAGIDVADITARPRKYGLHGTIKPPFRLAEGKTQADLESATRLLCTELRPVTLEGLQVAQMGGFMAIRPMGEAAALGQLAADCVAGLDAFRAPAPQAELDRRRAAGLTEAQEAYLQRWGYPYVMDEFRFHITLSRRLSSEASAADRWLKAHLDPLLPRPCHIRDMALVGEGSDGRFRLIHRYTLSG
ncbi:MAG: DUF1045 domain-containing protein [Pseudomonadota bacterium]